jgi:GntR family transcriptional regulator/MocR family aminotransferase
MRQALSGATLLYKTVYGEPCTIELDHDGTMRGRAGFANEDVDTGRWWIEGDFWCRQWRLWSYGETARFRTTIGDAQIRWFAEDGRLIDSAVYIAP